MLSNAEQRAVQEGEEKRRRRRMQLEEVQRLYTAVSGLSARRDWLRKRLTEVRAQPGLAAVERRVLFAQTEQALMHVVNDLAVASGRFKSICRELGL